MSQVKKPGIHTRAVHLGSRPEPLHGALSVPVYQTSTFAFESVDQGAARFRDQRAGYVYTRMGNPTVAALEEAVAELEGGHAAIATSSMATELIKGKSIDVGQWLLLWQML